jgi:hypothetical protein
MSKVIYIGLILFGLLSTESVAQIRKFYYTSGGELMFSSASINKNGTKGGGTVRFTGFINFNSLLHFNFSNKVGIYSGLELQNIGFIYKAPDGRSKDIYRSYNFSVPSGLKFGRMDGIYFYAAYAIEKPIHYKEKVFVKNEQSHNVSEWFSKRTPDLMHSLSVGVQLPKGIGIKAKYIFTGFFNKDFKEISNGIPLYPYQNLNANVFYISVTYNVLKTRRLSFNPFL